MRGKINDCAPNSLGGVKVKIPVSKTRRKVKRGAKRGEVIFTSKAGAEMAELH